MIYIIFKFETENPESFDDSIVKSFFKKGDAEKWVEGNEQYVDGVRQVQYYIRECVAPI